MPSNYKDRDRKLNNRKGNRRHKMDGKGSRSQYVDRIQNKERNN